MDVLSDVIAAMRVGRPHSNRSHRRAPWSARFQRSAGAGFHVVVQGSCWLIPLRGDPVELRVGDVVCVLPHHTGHGLADSASASLRGAPQESLTEPGSGKEAPEPDASTVLLCGAYLLERSRPHPLLAELPDIIHLPARVGRHPSLRAAIDLLGGELDQPGPGSDAVVSGLLDVLLLYILRAWYADQPHPESGWAAALADSAITAALNAIHGEPGRAWTVEELGRRAGLSRAAFARRFSALVGQPPLAYLTWWRMTTAARLLRDTGAPLSAVAARTGYTSEFAFAKAFKREFGTAPGGYRRNGRGLARPGPTGEDTMAPPGSGDV